MTLGMQQDKFVRQLKRGNHATPRATARVRPYYTTNRLARSVYSRGVPLRSPCRGAGTRPIKFLFSLCISLILLSFLFPSQASAHTKNTPAGLPTLQVAVGFEDDNRLNYWTPVQITLNNDGPDFKGVLSATTYSSISRTGLVLSTTLPWSYQEPVSLPHGTQKLIHLYVPFYESPAVPRGIVATLKYSNGKVITTQTARPFTLETGSLLIGILSDQAAESPGFRPLSAVSLPDSTRSIELATLNASTLPDMAEVLDNFDAIVLDDFNVSLLNAAQLSALQTWVNQGGVLIDVGGSQWQRTLGALPLQLLPVDMYGTGTLPAGTHLLPTGSPTIAETGQKAAPDTMRQSITISTATLPGNGDARREAFSNLETVLKSDTTPLIVQVHQGQGVICYLAFDPAVAPLIDWPGAIALWKGLLLRTLGDQSLIPSIAPTYANGPGQSTLRGGLFQILQPGTPFPVWVLVFLLLGYIIIIGPVRFFIVKRLKRPDWNWRIILSSVVVFSLLTYGLAYSQKGASINSISIIQLNQGGNVAHVTSFFSAFIPGGGNIQVHLPARSLAQPITNAPFQGDPRVLSSDADTIITIGQNETNINLLNIGPWTLHPIVTERDQQLHGGLFSHLALRGGTLSGTITNTLDTSLSDVYILMPHSFTYIGSLLAGQTRQVKVPLHSSTLSTGTTLADQIAKQNRLSVPYFPYANGSQPQNDFQRHLAILSALSGNGYSYIPCGGPCSTHSIAGKHVIFTPPFGAPKVNPIDGRDPLLVAGAPATLIGWADQPVDATNDITINGISPGGTHDNLVQVPLNVDFSASSSLPPGLIYGRVINAQGNEVQTTSPDVYTINMGTITFEFSLPYADNLQINNMTISEPVVLQPAGINKAQVRLYNWDTSSWDAITLNNLSFTTANTKAYTSSDGRVLLQVVNQDASQGAIYFGKPSLSLNDAVN
jgi:hypothetical protein